MAYTFGQKINTRNRTVPAGNVRSRINRAVVTRTGGLDAQSRLQIGFAGRDRQQLLLNYVDRKGRALARRVNPYSYRTKKGNEYFFAACSLHGDKIHSFRTDRIVNAVRLPDHTFEPQYPVEV